MLSLAKALRLGSTSRLALTGAGGKTSALFQLGRELLLAEQGGNTGSTILLTATTHLAVEQVELADHHFIALSPAGVEAYWESLPSGVILFTATQADEERFDGLSSPALERLRALAEERRLPLLIEADGSRRRPLKAPADHEPVIPPWAEQVVVVAGMSGLGKPLSEEWVHRPELFAALSGLEQGAPITPQALARVLCSPQGGLKGIPAAARRVALLNQADTPELQSQAQSLAAQLLAGAGLHGSGGYQVVLSASLAPPGGGEPGVFVVHEPVAGVVLAAGASSRMGQAKQTLPWRGEALVRYAARVALEAGLSPVVVVTGCAAQEVETALVGLDVRLVYNPAWEMGQGTSVAAGVRVLSMESGAVVFLLADQPHVTPGLVRSLVEHHAVTLAPIVAPLIDGMRANPVLFDCQTFPDLLTLSGDTGGRALFSRYAVSWLPWHDARAAQDIDTPEDYRRLVETDPGERVA